MTSMKSLPRVCCVAALGCMLSGTAQAYLSTQTLALSNGWNAVYLEVEPENPSCDSVFSNWPVSSVSVYVSGRASAGSTTTNGDVQVTTEYLTWRPNQKPGVNSLNSVMAGKAYLFYATNTFTRTVTGRPAAPRIEWVPGATGTNVHALVGFRTDGTAKFGTFLAGAGFDMSALSVYTVGGTNLLGPTLFKVGWTTASQQPIENGKAYMIACDKVSDFSGPVKVTPEDGFYIPADSSRSVLKLENEHNSNLTVTVTVKVSAPDATGSTPIKPTLWFFNSGTGWTNHLPPKVLQAGEDWTIPLAVDRTGMVEGGKYGAVLVCADTVGGRVEIPLEVDYAEPNPAHALWPAGLWVGDAHLDKVSQVLSDERVKTGVEAGSTLDMRLILHVDTSNRCRLLQRVILAGAEDTNGNWSASLYTDESKVPATCKSVRISSVAFGLDNNGIRWDGAGSFGTDLKFTYTIAANDPVNPFRHPYHPNHDGLDYDFATPLPSGDDFNNYMNEIKPELFSISNTISLHWSTPPIPGGAAIGWNPAETVSGTIVFEVGGLRREGPVTMEGQFELRRISKMGVLSTE